MAIAAAATPGSNFVLVVADDDWPQAGGAPVARRRLVVRTAATVSRVCRRACEPCRIEIISLWKALPVDIMTMADRTNGTVFLVSSEEDLAGRFAARLLITAGTGLAVESIARRIHAAGTRATLPFVKARASDLPIEPGKLKAAWCGLLAGARGGSLLLSDVEMMPPIVQDQLLELLDELECGYPPSAVRLVSGTTVWLLDRVASGRFSERLFYRLNILHVVAEGCSPDVESSHLVV
jgi:Sigma-54 interaction domain